MPSQIKTAILYYLPVVAWGGMIYILSSESALPGPESADLDFIFKKLAHIFVYAVLYFLLYRAVNLGKKEGRNLVLPLLLAIAYALTDEIHQRFTPGRTSTLRDIGFDFLGMSVVWLRLRGWI